MYIIVVYVPVEQVDAVALALANAGAGEIGNYRACAFRVKGQGQFEPKSGANPFIGEVGKLEKVEEVRLEVVCEQPRLVSALEAMISAHPYEEVAYHVFEGKTLKDFLQ